MPDLREILPIEPQFLPTALLAVLGALALLVAMLIARYRTRKNRPLDSTLDELAINIARLPATGPPAGSLRLEVYNTPMRLAVLVIAPAGRSGVLPEIGKSEHLIESIAPGMKQACDLHLPIIRRWPAQLSTQGFANAFFARAELPGDGGKGSPWSAVAGSFKFQGQRYLAGMICRAERPNGIGQMVVPRDEAWPEYLRIKS